MGIISSFKKAVGLEEESPEDAETAELRDKVEGWIGETWRKIRNSYNIYHQNVWRARLYQVGEFYIELGDQRQYWQPKILDDSFIPNPKINRFAPAIESVASNFSTVPEVEAVPFPKDDEKAMGVAEVCNELIEHFTKENAIRADYKSKEDLAGDASMMFTLAGCVFTDVHARDITVGSKEKQGVVQKKAWKCDNCDIYQEGESAGGVCPVCGQPVEIIDSEGVETEKDAEGNPVMEDVIEREVVVDIADSLTIFPRPGSKRMSETPYILRARRMPLDEIHFRWKYDAHADSEYPDQFNLSEQNRLNYYYVGFNQKSNDQQDACLVIEAYCEPDKMKDYPGGFYGVYINEELVYFKPWTEEFPEHPLTMGAYEQMPGIFFPRSIAFDLCEVQKEGCDYESLIKRHAMTSAVEPIIQDVSTVTTQYSGDPRKIIYYQLTSSQSKPPDRLKHGNLDDGVYKQRDQLIEEIENISKAVEVMRGKQPGSITANVALQTLRGQAELMYAKPVANWTALWKETVRKGIVVIQKNYTLMQLVGILGEDRLQQIQDFIIADLSKDVIFKSTAAGMPRTKMERKQEFIEMYDRGALDLTDAKVKEKIFELFGDTGAMSTFNEDARRARRNVRNISKGQPATFRAGIDDPETHLSVALEAAKDLSFDRWEDAAQVMLYGYIEQIRAAVAAMMPVQPENPNPDNEAPGGPASETPNQEGALPGARI